jgi:hypothetical protein
VTQQPCGNAHSLPEYAACRAPPFCKAKRATGIFLGLVVIAQVKHPVPSRTRKLSTAAPMVLGLKPRESRSPPNLEKSPLSKTIKKHDQVSNSQIGNRPTQSVAGWSSPVARQAHNLKVAGSNPAPATKLKKLNYSPKTQTANGNEVRYARSQRAKSAARRRRNLGIFRNPRQLRGSWHTRHSNQNIGVCPRNGTVRSQADG